MNNLKGYIILPLLLVVVSTIHAQNVRLNVSAPKVVSVGQQFQVTFTLNDRGANFKTPSMEGFRILMGPNTSSSSSMQIINGKVSQHIEMNYSFVLQALKEGTFTIESATVTVKGEKYTSDPFTIEVIEGSASVTDKSGNADKSQKEKVPESERSNLFVKVFVNKRSVYQGEGLLATIKLYSRVNIAGFENIKFPSFDGFWSQDVYSPSQIQLEQENVNGVIYSVGILKQVLLFPQKSGEIIIDPFELECIVRQKSTSRRRSIFDNFFNDPFFDDTFSYRNAKTTVKSRPVKIHVKPLPANKPASFTGGVGKLDLDASIDKNEVKTNDAITFKVNISGNGNLKLIDPPNISFPADFEVYDPKVSENIKTSAKGASGSKTYEYIIIPRFAGEFRVSPVNFSYFDPALGTYKTVSTKEHIITVEKGSDDAQSTVMTGFSKEDVKIIGSDILFIKTDDLTLRKINNIFFGSLSYYLALAGAVVVFFFILLLRKKKLKERENIALIRNKQANKLANRRLRSAKKHLKANEKEKFFEEILKGLWGYLSDKLTISVADLSKEKALEALSKYKIDNDSKERVSKLIDECEYAQYAPSGVTSQLDVAFQEAVKTISNLEQKLR